MHAGGKLCPKQIFAISESSALHVCFPDCTWHWNVCLREMLLLLLMLLLVVVVAFSSDSLNGCVRIHLMCDFPVDRPISAITSISSVLLVVTLVQLENSSDSIGVEFDFDAS